MNKQIKIVIILVVISALGFGGYFAYVRYFFAQTSEVPKNENVQPLMENEATSTLEKIIVKQITILPGFKLYKNSDFGFEIQYPESWIVSGEDIVNVRGENTKGFFFKKPNSDLRFAILPRDGLSYGVGAKGTSTEVFIGGFAGTQTQYILKDGRRLWLIFPQYGLYNWLQDLGRIDAMTSVENPAGDTQIFEKMLSSFKFIR